MVQLKVIGLCRIVCSELLVEPAKSFPEFMVMTHEARSSCGIRTVYLFVPLEIVPPPEHGGGFT